MDCFTSSTDICQVCCEWGMESYTVAVVAGWDVIEEKWRRITMSDASAWSRMRRQQQRQHRDAATCCNRGWVMMGQEREKLIETGFQTLTDDNIFVALIPSKAFDVLDSIQCWTLVTICNDFFSSVYDTFSVKRDSSWFPQNKMSLFCSFKGYKTLCKILTPMSLVVSVYLCRVKIICSWIDKRSSYLGRSH